MTRLSAPGLAASVAILLALGIHPALRLEDRAPWLPVVVTSLALLLALTLVARAGAGAARGLIAAGAVVVVCSLAWDALRGHSGTLTLAVGQGAAAFEESGPGGRGLGFRPLGFDVRLERVDAGGPAVLAVSGSGGETRLEVAPHRARPFGGFRFGSPRLVSTGEVAGIQIGVHGPDGSRQVVVGPGTPARAGDLEIALEQYFADFALDEAQRPFSRSDEHRNPAALLRVRSGDRTWRVFVMRALPELHRPEGLVHTFTLDAVEPADVTTLNVTRLPAARFAALGALLIGLGVALPLARP